MAVVVVKDSKESDDERVYAHSSSLDENAHHSSTPMTFTRVDDNTASLHSRVLLLHGEKLSMNAMLMNEGKQVGKINGAFSWEELLQHRPASDAHRMYNIFEHNGMGMSLGVREIYWEENLDEIACMEVVFLTYKRKKNI